MFARKCLLEDTFFTRNFQKQLPFCKFASDSRYFKKLFIPRLMVNYLKQTSIPDDWI